MKKTFSIVLALCMALAALTVPAFAEAETDAIASYIASIDMNYAYELALKLSTDPSMHDNAMGFRTSGSEAEHRAADFIASEMEAIGLVDVEKIPVDVDSWQFNGASLTIDGTDIALTPVSYMVQGTDEDGITAQIVDCGSGFAADYADKDVEGKIVLVGVDQWNEAWIDQYIYEAEVHGAAALVTYDDDGYGRWSDDVYQIQDVCCEADIMPTVIVTKNQGLALAEAIAAGNDTCTLIVDSTVAPGTSYDVVGRIPGRSSEQQMIVSGHYDMYFMGFQDDCSAIATAMSIGKGIIDSGYQPENDILIVAHGAEEWGATGTEFDWTRGAWELIHNVHPEWAEKTLALFNFELCAFDDGGDTFMVSCVPEYANLVKTLAETGALDGAVSEYAGGISAVSIDTTTMEDGISYRDAGVPYFINVTDTCAAELRPEGEYGWSQLHYHTESDDASTYCERVMKGNIGVFGATLIHIDQTPALELDMTLTCDDLQEAFDAELAAELGVDADAWQAALDDMRAAAEARNTAVAELNGRFAAASSDEERAAIREKAVAMNRQTLACFKAVQDAFIGIEFSSDVVIRHLGYQDNVALLCAILEALENGELFNEDETGALDLAWGLNALVEYNNYIFSPEVAQKVGLHVDAASDSFKWWGKDGFYLAETGDTSASLLEKAETGDTDFSAEIAVYEAALEAQCGYLVVELNGELEAMGTVAEMLRA